MKKYTFYKNGSYWPLDGLTGVWLTDVAGLGAELPMDSYDLSDGFRLPYRAEEDENGITATLIFREKYNVSAEERYRNLLDWMLQTQELRLSCYYDDIEREYLREVAVKSVTKTDDGSRTAAISLSCLSPWYSATETVLSITTSDAPALRYPYRYVPGLRFGSGSTAPASARISPQGHESAGIVLRVPGPLSSPSILLRGENSGKLYGLCSINGEIPEGSTLVYSSHIRDSFVAMETGGERVSLLDAVDLTYEPFFRAPVDEASLLELRSGDTISGTPTGEIRYYYRTV